MSGTKETCLRAIVHIIPSLDTLADTPVKDVELGSPQPTTSIQPQVVVSVSWEDGEVVFGWVKPTIHLSGSTLPECGHAWLGVQGWRYSFGPVALLLALNTSQKLEVGFSIPLMFPFSLPCAASYLLLKTLNGVSRVHLRLLC